MLEPRMEKLGIRGTATGRFACATCAVPKENILGPLGKGLNVALTVLDFGRTTFGACCTGAAKTCLRLAVEHANTRRQFNKTLGDFDLVKKKIGRMAADVYAMEAMTAVTASLIDRGLEDYMIETAMLKVFTTERACGRPSTTHSRSTVARPISMIRRSSGCCATRASIRSARAATKCSLPSSRSSACADRAWSSRRSTTRCSSRLAGIGKAWTAGMNRLGAAVKIPECAGEERPLRSQASQLGRLVWRFNLSVNRALIAYREPVIDMQLVQERIAGAAMEMFASACVISRLDSELQGVGRNGEAASGNHRAAELFLRQSFHRIRRFLGELTDNDDKVLLATANSVLGKVIPPA